MIFLKSHGQQTSYLILGWDITIKNVCSSMPTLIIVLQALDSCSLGGVPLALASRNDAHRENIDSYKDARCRANIVLACLPHIS